MIGILYIFWAILNIGLIIYVFIGGARYFRNKYGGYYGGVFVLVFLVFLGTSGSSENNLEPGTTNIKTWKFNTAENIDKHPSDRIIIDLEKRLIAKLELDLGYRIDSSGLHLPVNASTSETGFISGTSWKPLSIIVNKTLDNQLFEYEVRGKIIWSLIGLPLYHETKEWEGVIKLK